MLYRKYQLITWSKQFKKFLIRYNYCHSNFLAINTSLLMEKTYQPTNIESKYRQLWSDANLFSSNHNANSHNAYCIMLPPPNVTGSLHMGHAFQHTIMDVLTRYHRMCGEQTLWQPGTDHAGIATQMVVERQLNSQNINRHDLGREKFTEQIWHWKQKSGGQITEQMRRLGASVDWEKERFTMDNGLSDAVSKVFIDLYNEGLIYRGKRLVNWDPVLLTAVSDLEVINVEEQGFLWHIKYPVTNSNEIMIVATTRPETMLGDSAVAVHPDDKRHQHLIGKTINLPLTNRIIPIIADKYVDKGFGTGCVKITPAHDFNDYEIGKRHQLEIINIFTKDAHLISNTIKKNIDSIVPSQYQGLDRFKARKQILAHLTELDLLEKTQPHALNIPKGDRSGAILEPYLTDQWFVKVAPLAKPAIDAVKNGDIRFIPANWEKTYFNWMNNIQDWCISRQIWWGHRIPAWYDDQGKVFVTSSLEQAQKQAIETGGNGNLKQDDDVLDTWFSSALWPFSTLGWPAKTQDLARFYPTNVLVTGFDIIFFWVARMIMFGLKLTDKIPFKDIYITGLIRDNNGQKMSKSKGNVLDPIDLIDGITLQDLLTKRTQGLMQPQMQAQIIASTKKDFPDGIAAFGTDALRFTFCALASFGRDISFDLQRVKGYRNFCNKLWNASRFVISNLDQTILNKESIHITSADQWILSRLQDIKKSTHKHLADYRLDLMSQDLYDFVWHDYCDWYLEFSKPLLANKTTSTNTQQTLLAVLNEILKLLHPIIPFITEGIHSSLPVFLSNKNTNQITKISLMQLDYPKFNQSLINKTAEQEIDWVKTFILGVRRIKSEMNIAPNKTLSCLLSQYNNLDEYYLNKNQILLNKIAKLDDITLLKELKTAPESAIALVGQMKILIPLSGLIDKGKEIIRLQKELNKLEKQHQQLNDKLSNEKFIKGAPQAIINKEQEKIAKINSNMDNLRTQFNKMQNL